MAIARRRRRTLRSWLPVAASVAFASGCSGLFTKSSPPLLAPELGVLAGLNAGTGLSGSHERAEPPDDADPLVIRCRALWVEHSPQGLAPLEQAARLVLEPRSHDPVQVLAKTAGGIGFASGPSAPDLVAQALDGKLGRSLAAWDRASPLPLGFSLRVSADAPFSSGLLPHVALVAWRDSPAREATLGIELEQSDELQELLILSQPLRSGDGPLVLVFPRAAARNEPAALVVEIEALERSSSSADEDLGVALARADVHAEEATAKRRGVSPSEEERREIGTAWLELDRKDERRSALVFLADRCGAPLALDVALVAQEAELDELARRIRARAADPGDRLATGWKIESAAWEFLGNRATDTPLAPELSGILARHGGEAARLAGGVEDLLRGCDSVETLRARLVEENRILLQDASPASRVRAYDWLVACGRAPDGYDPLAPLAERRAALDALEERNEAASTPGERR